MSPELQLGPNRSSRAEKADLSGRRCCFPFLETLPLTPAGPVVCVVHLLRGVHRGRFRDGPSAGIPGGALLALRLLHEIQRAVQGLPLASYGEESFVLGNASTVDERATKLYSHVLSQDFLRCVTASIIYFIVSIMAVSRYVDGSSKAAGVDLSS